MTRDRQQGLLTDADAAYGWKVHPSHQPTLRHIAGLLILLAAIQYLAWLMPATPGSTGIDYYLALHALMETVSIVIAMMVFAVGWNSHGGKSSDNLVLLASMYFAVGLLDFSHTMSYGGMPDFISHNDSEKHLTFWLSARFLAAIALFIVAIRPWHRALAQALKYLIFSVLFAVTLVLNWSVIYHQEWLPHWFIPGQGLTPLKIDLEYLFIVINLATAIVLWRKMLTPQNFNTALLFGAVCIMAMSELFFTLYTTMTGAYNVLGHVYKVISYFLIYRAVVVEAIDRPYRELADSQQNLELAVTASNTGLWDWNVRTGQTYFSPVWKDQLGYTESELPNQFSTWESLLHPDDRELANRRVQNFLASPSQTNYESEFRLRHKDGSYHWILARGEKQCDAAGVAVRLLGSHADVTERKRAEDRFHSAVEASPNAMIMVDEKGLIILTNSQTDTLFGYERGELVGHHIGKLIPKPYQAVHHVHIKNYMSDPAIPAMVKGRELYALHKDGREFRAEIGLTPISGQEGRYVLASVVDITLRIQAEQRIEKLINYDVLTGLPNRQLLRDRVDHALSAARRAQSHVAILFIDLDHFKYVNDTLGHPIGDELLVEIGERLKSSVREADTVSRVGGDEFVIVVADSDEDAVARVATKLLEAVSQPYRIQAQELVVTPSIGIAMYPHDGADFETLYQHADTAMYRAKHDGRNDFRFFTKQMQWRTARVLLLESAMHHALERHQFHLVYQPQLAMDGRKAVGVEALLRWNHPELGAISPAEFIPLAESNGQIVAIGSWVLRSAVEQLKHWMRLGLPPMVLAVNLSAVQFRHANLPGLVTQVLDDLELPPEYLELELTEGAAMENPVKAIAVMDTIHARGVRMSIDDFGTGYSSLSYLKKFNVYKLKIDQSFVRDIATDAGDRAIVTAIIQMARSMGFKTIAEGVETHAQWEFLRDQGCDEVQGYFFSKPLPADQLESFIRQTLL